MDQSFIRRLAVLCKDYYVNRTIDDLFIYAGADEGWRLHPIEIVGSERISRFNSWVDGIKHYAPEGLDKIISKVALDIASNEAVPAHEREVIKKILLTLQPEDPKRDFDLEPLMGTLTNLLANDGLSREVAILVSAESTLEWKENDYGDEYNTLSLSIPFELYAQVEAHIEQIEAKILSRITQLMRHNQNVWITGVNISAKLVADTTWRDKAIAWLTGEGVNNQGRVRSDNVAPRTVDGLQFRSQPEIFLYQALKALGVSFAPLPVFVRGGKDYRRIEPDIVILKDGIVLVVEVDGDTFHRETPADAQLRTTMLENEGAYILHVSAERCSTPEKAATYAAEVITIIERRKAVRH